MASTISPDKIDDAIKDTLAEYAEFVQESIEETVNDVSADTSDELKKTSPKRTGKYAKSWRVKIVKERLGTYAIVYNKDHYRLTHLLENGHAKVNGGRVNGIEHIRPAEQKAIKQFEKELEEKLT